MSDTRLDVLGIGNALVDQQYNVSFELLKELKLTHGQMSLATKEEQERLINFLDHKRQQWCLRFGTDITL